MYILSWLWPKVSLAVFSWCLYPFTELTSTGWSPSPPAVSWLDCWDLVIRMNVWGWHWGASWGMGMALFSTPSLGKGNLTVQRKVSWFSLRVIVSNAVGFLVQKNKHVPVPPQIHQGAWSKWHSHSKTQWSVSSIKWREKEPMRQCMTKHFRNKGLHKWKESFCLEVSPMSCGVSPVTLPKFSLTMNCTHPAHVLALEPRWLGRGKVHRGQCVLLDYPLGPKPSGIGAACWTTVCRNRLSTI